MDILLLAISKIQFDRATAVLVPAEYVVASGVDVFVVVAPGQLTTPCATLFIGANLGTQDVGIKFSVIQKGIFTKWSAIRAYKQGLRCMLVAEEMLFKMPR